MAGVLALPWCFLRPVMQLQCLRSWCCSICYDGCNRAMLLKAFQRKVCSKQKCLPQMEISWNIQLPLVICFGESDCESTLGLEHGRTPVFDAAHLLPCFIATRMTYFHWFLLGFLTFPSMSIHFSYFFPFPFNFLSCHLYPVSGSPQIQKAHKTGFLASPKSIRQGGTPQEPKKGISKG